MEGAGPDESASTSVLTTSEEPPNLFNNEAEVDSDFPKVKSKILQKWILDQIPPKLHSNANNGHLASESSADDAPVVVQSPYSALTVDTNQASSSHGPSTVDSSANAVCRACNTAHRQYESYPDKHAASSDSHWIKCDYCLCWFHSVCVDLEPYEVTLVEIFSCKACEVTHGPTKGKVWVAPHRNKAEIAEDIDKPMEVGTKPWLEQFVKEEMNYKPPPSNLVTILERGDEFEGTFNRDEEWTNVYLIKNKAGLGVKMPEPGEIYIDELCDVLGANRFVDTIDVYRQQSLSMSIGRYRDLLKAAERPRLYNILSLEFTNTKLAEMIRPPSIVTELSWAERYWPDRKFGPPDMLPSGAEESCDPNHLTLRPNVELFCLMGMGGSFTDFHIDFGGSSVWYHVYKGRKIFYIVEPTKENLDIYQRHQLRTDKEEFLGSIYGDSCWRVAVEEGHTLMIPAGWIHAVYTPVDSLVFGGNFLTNLNVDLQMEVNRHENRCNFETTFLYPNFEVITWYGARTFIDILRGYVDDDSYPPEHIIRGAQSLIESLSEWIERDKLSTDKLTALLPSRPFIHGETQIGILNTLQKEFKRTKKRDRMMRKRMEQVVASSNPIDNDKHTEELEDSGKIATVRMSVEVPRVELNEPIGNLKLKIARKDMIEPKDVDEDTSSSPSLSSSTPLTPRIRIRLSDDINVPASVVTDEERRRSIDGVDVVSMFSHRSSSGRVSKPSSWLKEAFGDEIERETAFIPEEERKTGEDDDYEALEKAERGGVRKERKRRAVDATQQQQQQQRGGACKPKKSALCTSKQRLAEKMKSLKRK